MSTGRQSSQSIQSSAHNERHRELTDEDWAILLSSIDTGNCTPFIGIEACTSIADKRLEIARQWEVKFYDYVFGIDVALISGLNERIADEQLRQEFRNNQRPLSSSACIAVLERGQKWAVMDLAATYVIERTASADEQLKVNEARYPFRTRDDLVRAAQYISVQAKDWSYAKNEVAKELVSICAPTYDDPDEPYRILADLPFPVYITTNYNDFLYQVLDEKPDASPKKMICRWNESLQKQAPRGRRKPDFSNISPATPLVFHLYGHVDEPNSLVLTEDDYFELVSNIKPLKILPERVQRAIASNTLLFVGYRSFDWDLRVLLRLVSQLKVPYPRRTHIAVLQMEPAARGASSTERERLKQYFDHYFESVFDIRVFWGSCHDFSVELRERWQQYDRAKFHASAIRPESHPDTIPHMDLSRAKAA